MRANSAAFSRILLQCAATRGEVSRSISSSASLLSVPTRWPNTSSTLRSVRPLFSSATMVFSKVGGAGLVGDRVDLGEMLGERPLVGGQEMLGADPRERRRAERAGPVLKERIAAAGGHGGRSMAVVHARYSGCSNTGAHPSL